MKANPLFAPLHFANINRMQVGLFRELLLAHLDGLAILANGFYALPPLGMDKEQTKT